MCKEYCITIKLSGYITKWQRVQTAQDTIKLTKKAKSSENISSE
jgi:hypothetical protein